MTNPYEVLGVAPTASSADIQKAYRNLAKKLHPDLNPGDKTAEEKFKEVAGAYDLLGDSEKRIRFDDGEIDATGAERPQTFLSGFCDVGSRAALYEQFRLRRLHGCGRRFCRAFETKRKGTCEPTRTGSALSPPDRVCRVNHGVPIGV